MNWSRLREISRGTTKKSSTPNARLPATASHSIAFGISSPSSPELAFSAE
jgi:hypothetical protein